MAVRASDVGVRDVPSAGATSRDASCEPETLRHARVSATPAMPTVTSQRTTNPAFLRKGEEVTVGAVVVACMGEGRRPARVVARPESLRESLGTRGDCRPVGIFAQDPRLFGMSAIEWNP